MLSDLSYPLAQQIKQLLLNDDLHPALKQPASRELLTSLRQRARFLGHDAAPLRIRSLPKQRYEVVTYAGSRTNLLLATLAGKFCGCECDDITYASFVAKSHKDAENDFNPSLTRLLKRIIKDNLLADEALLTELAAPFDDGDSSKWSRWLPPKYRQRFLADQVFDRASTRAWISSLSVNPACKEAGSS